jgi:hypothetical protein
MSASRRVWLVKRRSSSNISLRLLPQSPFCVSSKIFTNDICQSPRHVCSPSQDEKVVGIGDGLCCLDRLPETHVRVSDFFWDRECKYCHPQPASVRSKDDILIWLQVCGPLRDLLSVRKSGLVDVVVAESGRLICSLSIVHAYTHHSLSTPTP